jgi:hypothetical protein
MKEVLETCLSAWAVIMYEVAFCFSLLYMAFSGWHPAIIWICFIGFLCTPIIVVIPLVSRRAKYARSSIQLLREHHPEWNVDKSLASYLEYVKTRNRQ